MSLHQFDRYGDAVVVASRLHADQTRKGTKVPYMGHLLAVSAIVIEHGGTQDEAIAALLHDAVDGQGGATTRPEIANSFGEDVVRIVDACSEDNLVPGRLNLRWRKRKQAHIAHLATIPASAWLVTVADKLNNARTLSADYFDYSERVWTRFNETIDELQIEAELEDLAKLVTPLS